MYLFQVWTFFLLPSLTLGEKMSSNVNYPNTCFFPSAKMTVDPVCCTYETAAVVFLVLGKEFNRFAESQRAKFLCCKTMCLMVSCQMTSFPDNLLASLRGFSSIKRFFKFFRGFHWKNLRPAFAKDLLLCCLLRT